VLPGGLLIYRIFCVLWRSIFIGDAGAFGNYRE